MRHNQLLNEHRRDLMRLTYLIVVASFIISAIYIFQPETAPELKGSIWTVWGGGALLTAYNFWFGSSAGTGRRVSDQMPTVTKIESSTETTTSREFTDEENP